ncbi:hypothetical protein [Nigerium massiliense]|uniref:hypothetical protein n=1 Tax=Nigerium massiliense TaxID=1522317 RepID=UPI000A948DD2|nr:hypothetical protein [Nigerium massiliense]
MASETSYTVTALTPQTWPAFEALVERQSGLFKGCWCTWFHPACEERGQSAEGNRAHKLDLVERGLAHAALVMDGDDAVAWAEYGTPAELPTIHHRKQYDAEKTGDPDFRVTCVLSTKHTADGASPRSPSGVRWS